MLKRLKIAKKPNLLNIPSKSIRTTGQTLKDKKHEMKIRNESFIMNIFNGQMASQQIFPYPDTLTADQRIKLNSLLAPTIKFFQEVNDPAKNEEMRFVAKETLKSMHELGLLTMQLPTEYGGLGMNNSQNARIIEICAAHDLGLGVLAGAHQFQGFNGITMFGTVEQKNKYLPKIAAGQLAGFCLTEESSGSDLHAMQTTAELSEDWKYYTLNGTKKWVTNGNIANLFTVFAQTSVLNESTGHMENKLTAFIVERGFEGVSTLSPGRKLGIEASDTSDVMFQNVKVPAENVLGGVGNGFKVAVHILNSGRFGTLAAAVGCMRTCISTAVAFANKRIQFGRKIKEFGVVQEKLAKMAMLHYVAESLAYIVASIMDFGSQHYHVEAAAAKCFCSEAAWIVADEAIQILGGRGYMRDAGLEKMLRDIRVFRIFEGTNEILKLFVALSGLQFAGMQKSMHNPFAGLDVIFGEARKRMLLPKATKIKRLIHVDLHPTLNLVRIEIKALNYVAHNLLYTHGKNIAEQQFIVERLANIAIDIFTSAIVISRASRALMTKKPSGEYEKKLAETWTFEAMQRVQANLKNIVNKESLQCFDNYKEIAKMVCDKGGVVQLTPLDV